MPPINASSGMMFFGRFCSPEEASSTPDGIVDMKLWLGFCRFHPHFLTRFFFNVKIDKVTSHLALKYNYISEADWDLQLQWVLERFSSFRGR